MNLKGRFCLLWGFFVIGNKMKNRIKKLNFFSPPNFVNIRSDGTEKYFKLWRSLIFVLINGLLGGYLSEHRLE